MWAFAKQNFLWWCDMTFLYHIWSKMTSILMGMSLHSHGMSWKCHWQRMRILLEINRILMSFPCHFHRIVTSILSDKKLQKINLWQGFEPLTFVVLADPLHPFAIQALLRKGELILQYFQGPLYWASLY